jgi:hypothetical protein
MITAEPAELDNMDVGVRPPHPPALAFSDRVYLFKCEAASSGGSFMGSSASDGYRSELRSSNQQNTRNYKSPFRSMLSMAPCPLLTNKTDL